MAIRVLSGIITCGATTSFVRIGFNPHRVIEIPSNSAATVVDEMITIGPNRNFTREPAKHIALRQVVFQRKHGVINLGEDIFQELLVNDSISTTEIKVKWDASVGATGDFTRIVAAEISYMIIGEVADS